jgi:hypothetical protein
VKEGNVSSLVSDQIGVEQAGKETPAIDAEEADRTGHNILPEKNVEIWEASTHLADATSVFKGIVPLQLNSTPS